MSLRKFNVTMYADDTSISHSNHDRLKELLQGNKLSLNIIKIQEMVEVSRPSPKKIDHNKEEIPSFVIDDAETDIFKKLKCLGVKLDDRLAWNQNTNLSCCYISSA